MVVAGGTDLLPNMKHGLFEPEVVVSLNHIDALKEIHVEQDGTLVIGATVTLADMAADERVQARAPWRSPRRRPSSPAPSCAPWAPPAATSCSTRAASGTTRPTSGGSPWATA